jgi:hypothetical protein
MKNNDQVVITWSRGLVITVALGVCAVVFAQSDSALNRSVTVERDFQPVIKAAGKISTRPAVMETTIEAAPVEYSEYNHRLPVSNYQSPNLLSQPTRFEPGRLYNGYVRGGFGHTNTLFDFGYHLDDGKKSILDVYAHHKAEWGLAALSKSRLGLEFTHPFSSCDLYFGINGGNIYYHKHGHFYDYSLTNPGGWTGNGTAYPKPRTFTDKDKTALWTAEVYLGVRANAKQDFQYMVQLGYNLFSKPGAVSEHQLHTNASFDWHREMHHVGLNLKVQNNLLQLGSLGDVIPDSLYRNRHNFRIEPYYAYEGRRVRLHVGVNIDMNIGRGHQYLSGTENISFAPSPHINFEAQVAKQWLTIYADVMGHHGLGSLQSYMEENRYSLIHAGIVKPCASYTPVDAELGFHIRPVRDLLVEIHGGYAYMLHEDYWIATADTKTLFAPLNMTRPLGDFIHEHADYQRGKIGAQINYHLQDVVRIHLNGDYYIWSSKEAPVYDRPNWELALRVDGRIDEHWSLYSDNHFAGSRLALATDGEHWLRPTIELDLGLQYDLFVGSSRSRNQQPLTAGASVLRPSPKPNLSLFFQLNNWLHHKNEIFYGYRSQGINFLLGATFRF